MGTGQSGRRGTGVLVRTAGAGLVSEGPHRAGLGAYM